MQPRACWRQQARGHALVVNEQHIALHVLLGGQRRAQRKRRGTSRHQGHDVLARGIDDGVGIQVRGSPFVRCERGHERACGVQHCITGAARQLRAPECLAHEVHAFVVLAFADQLAVGAYQHSAFAAVTHGNRAVIPDRQVLQRRFEDPLPVPVDHTILALGVRGYVEALAKRLGDDDAGSAVPALSGSGAVLFLVSDRGPRGHAL
ncbi:hypothetical protein D3C85_1143240 [compost metagenome]